MELLPCEIQAMDCCSCEWYDDENKRCTYDD